MPTKNSVGFRVIRLTFAEVAARIATLEREIEDLFCNADLILTQDCLTGEKALMYGKEMLEDIEHGRASEFIGVKRFLCIDIDNSVEAQQLEYVAAAVTLFRGSCCYRGKQEP